MCCIRTHKKREREREKEEGRERSREKVEGKVTRVDDECNRAKNNGPRRRCSENLYKLDWDEQVAD